MSKNLSITAALALATAWSGAAIAQETVRVGVILPYTGQFADAGNQLQAGIDLYVAEHGDEVAGKRIEIIRRDTGGIAPDVARRLAQELVVRDNVDILAGFALTPNAIAAGDISSQAQKLQVVMNAATASITETSPYIVRTSLTTPQVNYALGQWAYESGLREVYSLASDYGPGHDARGGFEAGFKAAGGNIVGSDGLPVESPDFSAYVERVRSAGPEGVYIFVPGGAQPAAIGRALAERGLTPDNTRIMGQGELTTVEAIESMGDLAEGIVTGFHYTMERDDPLNNAFVEAYREANNGRSPDFFSIGGYDGMHLIYEALKATDGDASGDALVEAAKGMSWDSPRGPVSIDPETRDIIQTVWIREVQNVDGEMQNVVIEQIPDVKDPVKAGLMQ